MDSKERREIERGILLLRLLVSLLEEDELEDKDVELMHFLKKSNVAQVALESKLDEEPQTKPL